MSQLKAAITEVIENQKNDCDSVKTQLLSNFPNTFKALKLIDDNYLRPKRRKGVNLVPVETKKNGITYYARFSYNGEPLKTKFNTHLNDPVKAEIFALENKDRLIEQYLKKKDGRIYKFLSEFYSKDSVIPEVKVLSERNRRDYNNKIIKCFIPFLKNEKIISFEQIKKSTLTKYQDFALSGNIYNLENNKEKNNNTIKPQSVANYMKPVKKIFAYLERKGDIINNVAEVIKSLPVNIKDITPRGCYDLDILKGVFNKRWKDDLSCLLCVIIYTTGMRNSEIRRINLNDIKKIGNCHFIQVKESKTLNGIRLIPLHDFVYKKILSWVNKTTKKEQIFENCAEDSFIQANKSLAKMLNVTEEQMKAENITFYSGRHFYKTLLSAEGLGENIEEIFMGHKVSLDVKHSYNHREKQGKERLIKKARQALSILDKCLFLKKP